MKMGLTNKLHQVEETINFQIRKVLAIIIMNVMFILTPIETKQTRIDKCFCPRWLSLNFHDSLRMTQQNGLATWINSSNFKAPPPCRKFHWHPSILKLKPINGANGSIVCTRRKVKRCHGKILKEIYGLVLVPQSVKTLKRLSLELHKLDPFMITKISLRDQIIRFTNGYRRP